MSNRWRVMVVDDDLDARTIIRAALSSQYEIIEAHDGLDALDKLDEIEPDFIVMDVMMPLMDGFETTRAVRNDPKFKNINVLFLSAATDAESMRKGYESGANLYMTKPCDPLRLLRNIELFFEKSPPRIYKKRYSFAQLKKFEEQRAMLQSAHSKKVLPKADDEQPPVPQRNSKLKKQAAAPKPKVADVPPPAAPQPQPQPVMQPSAPAAPEPVTAAADPAKPEVRVRVMLIDPDLEVLESCVAVLEEQYEVCTAENGLEAIEKIVHYEPDIIVLDAMMPKLSGYQLCQSLRRNAKYVTAPIIFLSTKASPKDREYARQLGANGFLAKPFDGQELLQLVNEESQEINVYNYKKKLAYEEICEQEADRARIRAQKEQLKIQQKDIKEMRRMIREESS